MKLMKMFAIGAVALMAVSCVSKKEYDALNLNYKQAIENVAERQREIQDLKAQNSALLSENNLLQILTNWWEKLMLLMLTSSSLFLQMRRMTA